MVDLIFKLEKFLEEDKALLYLNDISDKIGGKNVDLFKKIIRYVREDGAAGAAV